MAISGTANFAGPCGPEQQELLLDLPARRCPRCSAVFEEHTAATTDCTVCVRYRAVFANARKPRSDGEAPGIELTPTEFAAWFADQERICGYCHVAEDDIRHLGIRTQVGLPLARLGIDRLEFDRPYQLDNLRLCCFACNKAKSNTFTEQEMLLVGAAVSIVWHHRLQAARDGGGRN